MKRSLQILVLTWLAGFSVNGVAGDDDGRGGAPGNRNQCPEDTAAAIDAQFGPGTADDTECLARRHNVAVVAAWNNADTHRSGNGQQVINVRNLVDDYENGYGMEINEEYEVVVIAYGAGGRWLLNNAAYQATYGEPANPSRALVESLLARGVVLKMCQNTMRGNNWQPSDLIEGVAMVPAGVSAVVDYQFRGYAYLNP